MSSSDYNPAEHIAHAQALQEFYGPPISVYTRADALHDGTLISVDEMATQAGFLWPVALTRDVHEQFVQWDAGDTAAQKCPQDERGRLWDLLYTLALAMKTQRVTAEQPRHTFCCVPRDGRSREPQFVHVTVALGPGDDFEPVITVSGPTTTGQPVE